MSRPSKRSRRDEPGSFSPTIYEDHAGNPIQVPAPSAQVTRSVDLNFRSLSTCNRCRIRKHRCDQRLPICANCEKVGAPCVGYDPVTKKEIPRRYSNQFPLLPEARAAFDAVIQLCFSSRDARGEVGIHPRPAADSIPPGKRRCHEFGNR